MEVTLSNFTFFGQYERSLAEIGRKAEAYLHTDASSCLFNVRLFAEKLAKYAAVQSGVPDWETDNLLNLLNLMKRKGIFGKLALDLFHGIRKSGNKAVHTGNSDYTEASHHLKMAWKLAVLYHRAVSRDHGFNPQYVAPKIPRDYKKAAEHARIKVDELEAENAALKEEFEKRLKALEQQYKSRSEEQVKEVQQSFLKESNDLILDEKATRKLIDQQLRDAGWEADTENIRYSKGSRPEKGRFKAIAEWPTKSGPADYAMFCGLKLVGVCEAKKKCRDVRSDLGQSERYSRDINVPSKEHLVGKWRKFNVPFLFATNGRAYLDQLKEKSGIWFLDVRLNTNLPRPLVGWYTPEGLSQLLQKEESKATEKLLNESKDYLPLRDYQREAVDNVEKAIINGQRKIMIAMATGTGKTRTCIGLTYRLIKSGRFRRVLFLVDRTSLGDQAADSFRELKIEEKKSFAEIYNIKELEDVDVDTDTRVHFSTVQGLIKRVLYPTQNEGTPIPVDQYDCIVVDECHRGYTLDKELSDEEFEYRNEKDFISKYRRVIEYFDAVKIGLTATPALHTKDIFGQPVYSYSYREAVIDGYLVDFHDPYRIKTKLSEEGIKWEKGEQVEVYDPTTSSIEKLDDLPDQLEIDLGKFNTKVITEEFNRVVCEELVNHIEWDGDEKTLIFCARDDHADMVVRLLNEAFVKHHGEIDQEAIRKITDNSDRPKELIKRFKNERFPSIAVTVELLTTGIDVPKICNIVFLRRVRSRILYDQMIGRATRLCKEIGKDHFNIFDAVDLYNNLKDYSAMKPVTANPNVTLEELTSKLKQSNKESTKKHIIDQLIAKLNSRKHRIKGNKLEEFKAIMAGVSPEW